MSANSASLGRPKHDLETPALCLDLAIYRRNVQRMVKFIIGQCGIAWRPHMKGQKAPELAYELVAAGAIGVTCATVYEAEGLAEAGINDILIANQVAGRHKLARLARLAARTRILTATDSAAHLGLLSQAAGAEGVVLPVLIELDVGMNRCGVPPGEATVDLARIACRTSGIHFAGLMAWEGHTLLFEGEEKRQAIHDSIRSLAHSAELCRAAGIPVERVSCSGSGTFLHSGELEGVTEIQAGGGAFCDLNYRKWGLENEYAITVVTRVVSRPTPSRIIVDGGFKTMSSQHGPPKPMGVGRLKSLVLSAEHGILELEQADTQFRVGDILEFIPGYTDSTVCLHDELCVLEDGRVSKVWSIPGRSGRR